MCEGHDFCESKEDIREWLRGKFILLLYNQIRFESGQYFYDAAVKESRLQYIPVSSQVRQIIPHKVQKTQLELQDYDSIMLDEWTKIDMNVLHIFQ